MFRSNCDAPGDDVVGGFAQVMGAAPYQAIGKIQTAIGSVTLISASGAVTQATVGDLVHQHDTIETGADGKVGILFSDGTAFNLSSGARMVLNEFVYDPNGKSNSSLFNLSHGTFTFIAGKVAKTGGLRIDTPVGRIRGTAQNGGIGSLTLAGLTFAVMEQIQAASRSVALLDDGSVPGEIQGASRSHGFLDDDTLTYKHLPHGTFEIVTRDGRVILQDDPGETIQIDPSGSVTRIPNSSSRMADLQNAQQAALSTLSQGPAGAAPGGSSTDTFNVPLVLQPINFARTGTDAAPAQTTVTTTQNSSGFFQVVQPKPPPPVLSADAGSHPIIEIPHITGNTGLDTAPSATLSFTHLESRRRPRISKLDRSPPRSARPTATSISSLPARPSPSSTT